ncbi:MAG: dihydroneopterin aldolase [Sulfurimonadaceae bacterium]|nr:dihydroneopterin aldolase [Sulfurimonadaceae bacterium]
MTITIEELTFDAVIGILDFEREAPQRVRVDAVIEYSFHDGAYIDYAEVTSLIKSVMQKEQFGLIEDALEQLKDVLKARFALIESLQLKIAKPDILPDCVVSLGETYKF